MGGGRVVALLDDDLGSEGEGERGGTIIGNSWIE